MARDDLQALVDKQAEDEGLWFLGATANEAYLQQELRRLHAAIEARELTQDTRPGLLLSEVLLEVEGGVREDEVDDVEYDIREFLLSRRSVASLQSHGERCRWLRILVTSAGEEHNDRG